MASSFTYSAANDFSSGVALDSLTLEIQNSGITIALESVSRTGDNVVIVFKADLPTADKVILDGDPGDPPPYGGIIAAHTGVAQAPLPQPVVLDAVPKNSDGSIRVAAEKIDQSGTELMTPNWADPRTWYFKSTKLEGISMVVDPSNDRVYLPANVAHMGPWIDNRHGRYSDEDTMVTEGGDVPRMLVYEDGTPLVELDPQWRITPEKSLPGDYVVDYCKGRVVFHKPPTGVITVDVWKAGSSLWVMKPSPGKLLKLDSAEVQFSADVSVNDTIIFETFGYADVFAPHLLTTNGGPLAPGTKITISKKIYKNMHNFIDEANGSLPVIPMSSAQQKTWRDLPADIVTYPWNYRYFKVLNSTAGMEVHIYLEHDEPFDGHATATFYCISEDV